MNVPEPDGAAGRPSRRARLPAFLDPRGHRAAWIATAVVTVLVLAWLVATARTGAFAGVVERIGASALWICTACLVLNGMLDVVWLRVVAAPRASYAEPLRVVGWQMLAASILPARLGELAWIYLVHRWMSVPPSRALFMMLYHRLQDLLATAILLLGSLLIAGERIHGFAITPYAAAGLALMALLTWRVEAGLTLVARALRAVGGTRRHGWLRSLLAHVLQVRLWYRHHLPRPRLWASLAVIFLRWAVIVAGIATLIHAEVGVLDWAGSVLVTNLYIYMSVIPVQAVGGFGAGEAGLAWVLTLLGLGAARASALSLLIRVLINAVHVLLWLFAVLAVSAARRARAGSPP